MKLNETTYLQRRNIEVLPPREDDPEDMDPQYTCDSRFIDEDTYDTIVAQQTAEENDISIMEALADLYESINS